MSILADKNTKDITQGLMRVLFLAPAVLACAASGASAADLTFEQLLATPSPSEIVAKWKAVCLEHAGDTRAQRRAARELNIDWPYQAMFEPNDGEPACMVVSSTQLDATAQAVGDALTAATSPLALENVELRGRDFKASTVIDGSVFRVEASLFPSQGVLTAVVALVDTKEQRQ